jgi:hypothetical protein
MNKLTPLYIIYLENEITKIAQLIGGYRVYRSDDDIVFRYKSQRQVRQLLLSSLLEEAKRGHGVQRELERNRTLEKKAKKKE